MEIEDKIIRLKKSLEKDKQKLAETQGRIKQVRADLKRKFGVSNIDDGLDKLEGFETKIKKLEKSLKKQIEEIENA